MSHDDRAPLPKGTIIEFCGDQAEVVQDLGGDRLTILLDGFEMRWRWEFEGECCQVVALPSDAAPAGPGQ